MFDPESILSIIETVGVQVDSETANDFLCFCPFHSNRVSPSLTVSKVDGLFMCHNPDCGRGGNLYHLVSDLIDGTEFDAARLIREHAKQLPLTEALEAIWAKSKDESSFDEETMARLVADMSPQAMDYLRGRGLSDETIRYFNVGYSQKRKMVVIPVYSPRGMLYGVVGRSISGKAYKNSKGSHLAKTLFNVHNAKVAGDTVVITEGAFDAMKVHEAGWPCVVATLGGHLSDIQKEILGAYFTRIIIMTDADGAGRALGKKIHDSFSNKLVKWAVHPALNGVYNGAKDAGEMSTEDIMASIRNAKTTLEVRSLFGVSI